MTTFKKHFIGTDSNKERIYLSAPSWDCGRYWGFGYLGNANCHYHLSGYANGRNINMHDALQEDYLLCKALRDDATLWTFCELVQTAYTLKEGAELFGRGGSHYTLNPCADLIKDENTTKHINDVLLPAIFEQIDHLFSSEHAQAVAEREAKAQAKRDAAAAERAAEKAEEQKTEQAIRDWLTAHDIVCGNWIYFHHTKTCRFDWKGFDNITSPIKRAIQEALEGGDFPVDNVAWGARS